MSVNKGINVIISATSNIPWVNTEAHTGCLNDDQVKDAKDLADGARNTKEALLSGLSGLGQLIWCAGTSAKESENNPGIENIEKIGWMIQEIAEIIDGFDHVEASANYSLHQHELIKAKQEVKS